MTEPRKPRHLRTKATVALAPKPAVVSVDPPARAAFPRERFIEFCSHLEINTKDFGRIPFKMLESQLYILDEVCRAFEEGQSTVIVLKMRQAGSSTFFIALDMFMAFEHYGLQGAFATHEEASREYFRRIIRSLYASLPQSYKRRVVSENRGAIEFDNESALRYLVAGVKDKATSNMGRSGALNFCHASEVAFWGSEEDLKELRATFSSRFEHQFFIFESTANGYNFFEEMWSQSANQPTVRRIFVGWYRNELYRFERDHPNFLTYMPRADDERLTKIERERIREVQRLYGLDVCAEQLAWYRWKLVEDCGGDQAKMDENFPWTADDAFVATGSKYFTASGLSDAMRRARGIPFQPYLYRFGAQWLETEVEGASAGRHHLKVWEHPKPNGVYAIGCDPAFGTSDRSDRSCIQVFRAFADKAVQVAEYNLPTIETHQLAWVLCHLAGYYGDTMVNLEISGPGAHVFQEMNRLKREMMTSPLGQNRDILLKMRHYLYRKVDNVSGGGLAYQTRVTRDIKWQMLSDLKSGFEVAAVVVNSLPLLDEMKTMVIQDGTVNAGGSAHDDRVMAAALAVHAWAKYLRPRLIRDGMTIERAYSEKPPTPPGVMKSMVVNYLRTAGIDVEKRK